METEQALLLGHPLHPTPKGLCGRLARVRARAAAAFPLHWLSVDAERVEHDSATGTPAPELAARLLGPSAAPGRILLPAHPWEAGYLRARRVGAVRARRRDRPRPARRARHADDVGAHRLPRRLAVQLKFSLHARVTNSMRVTLPKELRRAVEAARLAQTPVGARARRVAPRLRSCTTPRTCRCPGEDGF